MNFLKRIKELKKESKKIKFKELPKWTIILYALPFLEIPMILKTITGMLSAKSNFYFIFNTSFFGLFFLGLIASFICIYIATEELKQDRFQVSEKDINNFILSFPEEYRKIVIENMSKFSGKKGFISVKNLNDLEKLLTINNLKLDMINNEIVDTLLNSKNSIIKPIKDLNLKEKNKFYQ